MVFLRVSRRIMLLGSGALVLVSSACGDSSTAPGGESEIISRVTLTLTSPAGVALTTYIDDSDGNGPTAPSAQVAVPALVKGVTYSGVVKFENRLASPAEDITEEVKKESNEHRVFYTVTGNGVTVTTTDVDSQNRPLGVRFNTAVAGTAAGNGTMRVVLCHYDSAPKVATATTCTGETDIDVTFNYTIAP
ncbi:type 1 periplasmic binding fold superfamily protein [Gemmatimonas sp.]|jgi:hypothetical protein|uniref:type 1 periplasmic binding fold superfamily protein n=1 Tax=Gemmatimonas sp. TaxID=1962908 RepID=UPI0037BEC831